MDTKEENVDVKVSSPENKNDMGEKALDRENASREKPMDQENGREQPMDQESGREQPMDQENGREKAMDQENGREKPMDQENDREKSMDKEHGRERHMEKDGEKPTEGHERKRRRSSAKHSSMKSRKSVKIEKPIEVLLPPEDHGRSHSATEAHAATMRPRKSKVARDVLNEAHANSTSDNKKKLELQGKFSRNTEADSSTKPKPKKAAGWNLVNKVFNPNIDVSLENPLSTKSYDLSSQPTSYLTTRSSFVTEELKREHADRTQNFGNDLLNRIQQKRKMAHMLITQLQKQNNVVSAKPNTVLMAFMSFWNSSKKQKDFLIPKDRAAWLEFLVQLVRKKTKIQYLSNKELKKVIIRTRPNLAHKKHILSDDPDCPECFFWNKEQVADWVESIGYRNLREAFLVNCITGRRLVTVDVNALRQMGLKYFDEMKFVAGKIRELLGLPRPNILRAIMRIVPFEQYLRKRVDTGKTYDMLNFERFCEENDFDYNNLKGNKNAVIPCTTEVFMIPTGVIDEDADMDKEGSDEEEISLLNAPTVEFVVRNSIIRNKIVTKIIEEILKSALVGQGRKLYGKGVKETMKDALYWGLSELGLEDDAHAKERLQFASSVAQALLKEIHKTSAVLDDIEQVERYVGEKVGPEKKEYLKEVANQFMEDVMPIAAVLALGELDLEVIFRDATGLEEYVGEVIDEAERTLNSESADAEEFIRDVCDEAYQLVQQMRDGHCADMLPYEVQELVQDIIEELLTNAYIIEAVGRGDEAEAWDIIVESKDRDATSNLEHDAYALDMFEDGQYTDFDNQKSENEEEKGKEGTTTTTIPTVDNEVKIGMIQVSSDKTNKERKKRTELTVSDSSSRGRDLQASPLTDGVPHRRVGSDTSLKRSPLNPTSAYSLKSNSTGEFSVDSSNLRSQYSEAFKQIAHERVQRVTEKHKLALAKAEEQAKAFSVPNSPMKNGEDENARQTVSNIILHSALSGDSVSKDEAKAWDAIAKSKEKQEPRRKIGSLENSLMKAAQAVKQIGQVDKQKLAIRNVVKAFSLPNSPQKRDGDKGNARQTVSSTNLPSSALSKDSVGRGDETEASSKPIAESREKQLAAKLGKQTKVVDKLKKEEVMDSDHRKTRLKSKEEEEKEKTNTMTVAPTGINIDEILAVSDNRPHKGKKKRQEHSDAKSQGRDIKDSPLTDGVREGTATTKIPTFDKEGKIVMTEVSPGKTRQETKKVTELSDSDSPLTEDESEREGTTMTADPTGTIPTSSEKTSKAIKKRTEVTDSGRKDRDIQESPSTEGEKQKERTAKTKVAPVDKDNDIDTIQASSEKTSKAIKKRAEVTDSDRKDRDILESPPREGEKQKERTAKTKVAPGDKDIDIGTILASSDNRPYKGKKKRHEQTNSDGKSRGGDIQDSSPTDGETDREGTTTTQIPTFDNEGKIIMTQVSPGKTKKGTELTDSYSELKIRANSDNSLKSNSSEDIVNERSEESDPKKLTVSERAQIIVDKHKLALSKERELKVSSVPNSPPADREEGYLRQTVSNMILKSSMSIQSDFKIYPWDRDRTMSLASPESDESFHVENESDTDSPKSELDELDDPASLALKKIIKEKKLHRRQLVEHWAHEQDMAAKASAAKANQEEEEEKARIMRITADQIVSDIIQLALTHMLLQAESGNDAENLLAALKKIQVSDDKDNHEHTVILWNPNIAQSSKPTSLAEFKRKKAELASSKGNDISTKDGLKKASKEAIVSALKDGLAQKNISEEPRPTRRYNKAKSKPTAQDDEEITRL